MDTAEMSKLFDTRAKIIKSTLAMGHKKDFVILKKMLYLFNNKLSM